MPNGMPVHRGRVAGPLLSAVARALPGSRMALWRTDQCGMDGSTRKRRHAASLRPRGYYTPSTSEPADSALEKVPDIETDSPAAFRVLTRTEYIAQRSRHTIAP